MPALSADGRGRLGGPIPATSTDGPGSPRTPSAFPSARLHLERGETPRIATGCSRSLPCPQMAERAPCQTANNLMDQGGKDPLLEVWVIFFFLTHPLGAGFLPKFLTQKSHRPGHQSALAEKCQSPPDAVRYQRIPAWLLFGGTIEPPNSPFVLLASFLILHFISA